MPTNKAARGDQAFDMAEAVDEARSGEGDVLWHLLIAEDEVEGCEETLGAYLISRCLLEAQWEQTFDTDGRFVPLDPMKQGPLDPVATRVVARVRKVVSKAQRIGVRFLLCYHVEGDAAWHIAWSGHYDKRSAIEELKNFLQGGMFWP